MFGSARESLLPYLLRYRKAREIDDETEFYQREHGWGDIEILCECTREMAKPARGVRHAAAAPGDLGQDDGGETNR
jgi:hypothetical protein